MFKNILKKSGLLLAALTVALTPLAATPAAAAEKEATEAQTIDKIIDNAFGNNIIYATNKDGRAVELYGNNFSINRAFITANGQIIAGTSLSGISTSISSLEDVVYYKSGAGAAREGEKLDEAIVMPQIFGDLKADLADLENVIYNDNYNSYDTETNVDAPHIASGSVQICSEKAVIDNSVLAGSNIEINANSIAGGNENYSGDIVKGSTIASENGNITLNCSGKVNFTGLIYAPNGTVTINADDLTIGGNIVAQKVIINSNKVSATNYAYQGVHTH